MHFLSEKEIERYIVTNVKGNRVFISIMVCHYQGETAHSRTPSLPRDWSLLFFYCDSQRREAPPPAKFKFSQKQFESLSCKLDEEMKKDPHGAKLQL